MAARGRGIFRFAWGVAAAYAPRMPAKQPTVVADGKVVTLHYKLSLDGQNVIVDTEADNEPMSYLHGASNIIPGLEAVLAGRAVGEVVEADIEPSEGYGDHDPDAIDNVPRDAFPEDLKLEPGLQLSAEDEDGSVLPCIVKEIHDDHVVVDMNHPLAGETLYYVVRVLEVRDATSEEEEHGHVHGEGGEHDEHHH